LREAEKLSKHEVMANIEVYSELCPKAAGIIHLGATSCFVQDNADLIIQKEAFHFIMKRIIVCLRYLTDFAKKHARNPTLGRTHYQPASLVTVGKRACIWAQELLMALRKVKYAYSEMRFRGIKGATGTQDTFLTLFHGKEEIVEKLDQLVTEKAGFINRFHICGQNYPRQQDTLLLFALSNIGSIAKRIAHDIRILQGWDEIREPFEKNQVGSSAMPYKRNPIKCERICGLGRILMKAVQNGLETAAEQGFERTLDDTSNRRIVIPDAFLLSEAILKTLQNVLSGLIVQENVVKRNVLKEIPLIALEKAMMLLTESGVNRQEAHAKIQQLSLEMYKKQEKGINVNMAEIFQDEYFKEIREQILVCCDNPENFCGRSASQVNSFLENEIQPCIQDIEKLLFSASFKMDSSDVLNV